jgi:hypothetical protein
MKLVMKFLSEFLLHLKDFLSQEKESSMRESQRIQMKEFSQFFTFPTIQKFYLFMMVKSRRFKVLNNYLINLI